MQYPGIIERRARWSCDQYRVVHAPGGVTQGCLDIFLFEIRKFLQNLLRGQSGGEEIQNVDYSNAHTANAWTATALLRVDRNPIPQIGHRPPAVLLTDHSR